MQLLPCWGTLINNDFVNLWVGCLDDVVAWLVWRGYCCFDVEGCDGSIATSGGFALDGLGSGLLSSEGMDSLPAVTHSS